MQTPTGQFAPFPNQLVPVGWQPAIPVLLPAVQPPRLMPRTVPALVDEGVRVVRNQPCTLAAAYAHACRRYWSLLGASLLSILAVGAMTAFTFSIGAPFALFLYVSWQLAPQAVVLEGRRARAGLARSDRLAHGSWWRLAGLLIVVGILRLFAAAVPGGLGFLIAGFTSSEDLLGGGAGVVVLAIVASLVDIVMTPIAVTVSTLYFSDLRLRREGFDIDLLLQRGAAERAAREAA
ncbi:MAG: hypothetical protein LC748_14710 [Thermomicrobia bacterium]|nr:hypothetical protein [Thermomicrobia bacterium]